MISYVIKINELIINDNTITFKYPIYKAQEFNGLIIVLLEFSNNNPFDFINELYALSESGEIVWKMEDVKKTLGDYKPAPLTDFTIINNKLIAFDHYSRRYTINTENGKIINMQIGRW